MRLMISYPISYSMSFDCRFNPFTFKVIIDRHLSIDIFSYLCLCLTVFLPFFKVVPLAFLVVLAGGDVLFESSLV